MYYKDKLIECAETIKNFCEQCSSEELCPFFRGYTVDECTGLKVVKCALGLPEPCTPCNWPIGE